MTKKEKAEILKKTLEEITTMPPGLCGRLQKITLKTTGKHLEYREIKKQFGLSKYQPKNADVYWFSFFTQSGLRKRKQILRKLIKD